MGEFEGISRSQIEFRNYLSKMDTMTVAFDPTQFEAWSKIIESSHETGLSPQTATLIAATIGALAGFLPQFLFTWYNSYKEKKAKLSELRVEESRLGALIGGQYENLAFLTVSYEYYWRVFEKKIPPDFDTSLTQFHYFRDELAKQKGQIASTIAEYTKIIAHYGLLSDSKTNLVTKFKLTYTEWLSNTKDSSDFKDVSEMNELTEKSMAEHVRVKREYGTVQSCFCIIQGTLPLRKQP